MSSSDAEAGDRPAGTPAGETQDRFRDGVLTLGSDRRRLAVSIVLGLLLATGVVLLIGRASGFAKLVGRLREANPGWIILGVLVEAVSILGYMAAFRAIVGTAGPRMRLGTTAHVVLASLGATRLVSAAGAGGLAVNYWALRRLGLQARESVIRVLTLNTLLYALFGLIGLVSAAAMLARGSAPAAIAVPWIVVVTACFVAARALSRPDRVKRLSRPPASEGNRAWLAVRRGFAVAVAGVGRVRAVLAAPFAHRELIAGAIVYWAGDIGCLWLGLRAFGVETSLGTVVLGYATGYAANILPLPTGGVGGVDAAMTFALHALGVPLEDALAGVIAYRFVAFWLPTIPAAWALATLPRLGRSLEAAT